MNTFVLKIRPNFIEEINQGRKKHEYRLNNEERQKIKLGDRLVLLANDNSKKYIEVKVRKIEVFHTWEEALNKYWEYDFKGLYSSMEEALKICFKFYKKDEVSKYGIRVFHIEHFKMVINNSNFLLDTNIIIERESSNNVDETVISALKGILEPGGRLFVSNEVKIELEKYKNKKIKDTILKKLASYDFLNNDDFVADDFFKNNILEKENDANDNIDNILLAYLYNGKCDFFITNDDGIKFKARKLFLDKRVLKADEVLKLLSKNNLALKEYLNSNIKVKHFRDVSINDPFFDSLKEDYGDVQFTKWFESKANNECYVYQKDNNIEAFLYLKIENKEEDYSDFEKPFNVKKSRLKIGTFKNIVKGKRLGERFIQIIIDTALSKEIDEIYVTLFENKREEVVALKNLFLNWGFEYYTKKKSNGELVLLKKIDKYSQNKSIKENYPLVKEDANLYFLPIKPEYHFRMFPDLILEREKGKERYEIAIENCLEKIYATKFSYFSGIEPGDLLVIYRMGEEGRSKKYGSCITGIAIFEEYKKCSSKEEFLKFCKNITVFSTDELNSFYDNNYKSIVKMIYLKPIQPKIILKELQDKGLIGPGQGPRILEKIDKNKFCKILNEKGILP